jgi:hypothetical protein
MNDDDTETPIPIFSRVHRSFESRRAPPDGWIKGSDGSHLHPIFGRIRRTDSEEWIWIPPLAIAMRVPKVSSADLTTVKRGAETATIDDGDPYFDGEDAA